MKKQIYTETFSVPEGVDCSYSDGVLTFSKDSISLQRRIDSPLISVKADSGKISFTASKPGKRERKLIKSYIAHIENIISGLGTKFVYRLETCNVHFPMTLKVEKDVMLINNFLGEKTPRRAIILPSVEVSVKGAEIKVSSHDKAAAGQTAANMEKATRVRNRDRRVFQDGIYITDKPIKEASE
jgi:large subunit ribosomal protein L6